MNVIKFSAEWCGPCKAMAPLFKKASEAFPDIKFIDADVEDNPEMAEKYNIRNVPTFVIVDNDGEEKARRSGSMSYNQLCSMIDSIVA